jgi:hypothetical protein
VYRLLGQPALALDVLTQVPADAPTWQRAFRRHARALAEFGPGPACRAALEQGMQDLNDGGVVLGPDIRLRLTLELARYSEPALALQGAIDGRRAAQQIQHEPLVRMAGMYEVEASLALGLAAQAAALADRMVDEIGGQWDTFSMYLPELWGVLVRAWDAAGQHDKADALNTEALTWIELRASEYVPSMYRRSFLDNNRFNVFLLKRAARPQR